MTYTIPAESPKAVKAAAFGRELVAACRKRGIPLKELERATGVGHTTLDHYRRGLSLPKVEVARALAAALEWPKLGAMIVAARTFVCARSGCGRTFRNDTGAPRRYCSGACQHIAAKVRLAHRRARSAGQTGDGRSWIAAAAQLRSGLAIADERARLLESAIAAMCGDCEPEGVCRTPDCALRPFSPLPLEVHPVKHARTEFAIRSAMWTPARRARQRAAMTARWADPDWAAEQTLLIQAVAIAETPEHRKARGAKVSATKRAARVPA